MISTDIRIDTEGAQETPHTLVAAILALLRSAGSVVTSDDINVALGNGLSARFCCKSATPHAWIDDDQDRWLPNIEDIFDITLRDLHPRDAASGLNEATEFHNHFIDSYCPLIQRALANGQPVLARGGWSNESKRRWGIITSECDGSLGLSGSAAGLAGSCQLTSAATQCYVVERLTDTKPEPVEILRCGIDSIRSARDPESVVGPDAYNHWIAWAEPADAQKAGDEDIPSVLMANYSAGIRFLTAIKYDRNELLNELLMKFRESITEAHDALSTTRADRIESLKIVRSQESRIHEVAAQLIQHLPMERSC